MYIRTEMATYHYEEVGHGPALILLHGFTGTLQTWKPYIEKWADTHRVIAIDLPGHGKTRTQMFPSMEVFVDELAIILKQLNVDKCTMLGYSMGGRTALSFAVRYPEQVSRLILESASPGLQTTEERAQRQQNDAQLASRIESEGLEAFVNRWENTPLFASQKSVPETKRQAVRNERLSQTEAGLAASLRYMGTGAQQSNWDHLQRLQCPVHLVVGALDQKFVRMNQLMEQRLPYASLQIVPNTGHAIHVENDVEFDKLVKQFIIKDRL